jgi:hypothetical protein
MPSAYTAEVQKGITFNQFAMLCARAMGATIMMHDEPFDAPIPERFEPSDHYAKALEEARTHLAWVKQMPLTEAEREAKKEHEANLALNQQRIRESRELRAKYDAMLQQVMAWRPPTEDHIGLQEFMVHQLRESINFDCDEAYYEDHTPILRSAEEWKQDQIAKAEWRVSHYEKCHAEEIERVNGRNEWLKALRESLAGNAA